MNINSLSPKCCLNPRAPPPSPEKFKDSRLRRIMNYNRFMTKYHHNIMNYHQFHCNILKYHHEVMKYNHKIMKYHHVDSSQETWNIIIALWSIVITKWTIIRTLWRSIITLWTVIIIYISYGFVDDIPEYQPRSDRKTLARYVTRRRRQGFRVTEGRIFWFTRPRRRDICFVTSLNKMKQCS